ncbi:nuclease-related domain-containing protein [Bacillus alkalicellulosilyticus]|uniref:nuclease-related domain-containing protein n=1 Tax=Alkalihalobacterium alkalicellulosilyticum TaxID=1912214 RepID=UPI000997D216|nr:nuclease-related domain-containing protein [Bacillus alkalicellulosilyticus]
MIFKRRTKSDELLTLQYVNRRMILSEKEKYHYHNLKKGYEGEEKFDKLLEGLKEERLILNDLLFDVNNSFFQIDTLIISEGFIHLLDIKNFEHDCYFQSDKLYSVNNDREYKNPVDQLKRSTTLFRQLLHSLKQNYIVKAYVIFIHPEFTLYQAPMDQPFIFPNQINRLINELNNTPSKLNEAHKKLAQQLLSLHHTKNPFSVIPNYTYDSLRKGTYCNRCHSFMIYFKNTSFICKNCGGHEKLEITILRNVKEYMLLFPERLITTVNIFEWCDVALNDKTIRRILKKHLNTYGNKKGTYYK